MTVTFVFSDESGDYKPSPGKKFLRAHPYYCRTALAIPAPDWVAMRPRFERLRKQRDIPAIVEAKWSSITAVIQHRRRGEPVPTGRAYSLLAHISDQDLLSHVEDCLGLLGDCPGAWVVQTYHRNDEADTNSVSTMLRFHLQDIMQRTEMELRPKGHLGVMLFDATDDRRDQQLRRAYAAMYRDGDIIERYRHVKDTIGFEASHQSFGICLADYAAGVFHGWLRGYPTSSRIWNACVRPRLRKSSTGEVLGYGLIEVPKSRKVRTVVRERLAEYDASPERASGT